MSGPVTAVDAPTEAAAAQAEACDVEITPSRRSQVGGAVVSRALPQRRRRTVGAWCFVDHIGPTRVGAGSGLDIGPHPHIGLQTVTWLLSGEVLHRDSLGSEQLVRPGQLNLMTAGHGVAHAEEATGYEGELHGVQLWVAQPSATRDGAAAFEHHAELPQVDIGEGTATVLVGDLAGGSSPARRDTDHVGASLDLRPGRAVIPLRPECEHALVLFDGRLSASGCAVEPGHLAYLGLGRDEVGLTVEEPARVLLIGGVPFPEPILLWWNYVGRARAEISVAHHEWTGDTGRFGRVDSPLPRIVAGPPPWEPPAS